MSRSVMLVPVGKSRGIYPSTYALNSTLNKNNIKSSIFNPFDTCENASMVKSSIAMCKAAKLIAKGQKTELIEKVIANFQEFKKQNSSKVFLIEGVQTDKFDQDEINALVANALDCSLIFVLMGTCDNARTDLNICAQKFGKRAVNNNLGNIILNQDAPKDASGKKQLYLQGCGHCACSGNVDNAASCSANKESAVDNIVATIKYDMRNYGLRAKDLAQIIDGKILSGDENTRVFKAVLDPNNANIKHALVTNSQSSNQAGIVIATDGAKLEGKCTISTQRPLMSVLTALYNQDVRLHQDDSELKEYLQKDNDYFCSCLINKLSEDVQCPYPPLSPAAFRYKLTELAIKAGKRIALPEGDEPRTVCAAAKVAQSKIATPILFGNKDAILAVAKEKNVDLSVGVEFVDPNECRGKYVDRLVELRKSKGLTPEQALQMLEDNVVLATMMLESGEVDGLVSGAVHTTANTIRPPLQIIKTAPNASLVSSVFFMLMPDQVYVFGDCAINPNPKPEELAEIAIQSADTAKTFGIEPKVAFLSYSTGTSGKGPDVDAVVQAVQIAKEKRPDLNIDGPLQYDAAVMPDVAAQKAPGSKVAGAATVFIFPSLEVGNIAYKAVQRSADLVSIGPMLQGMRKPVNDLSRGALVDDIVYTIAITAIQATAQ